MELAVRRLEQAAMALACLAAVVIMLVISYDAVARYLFNAPLSWSFELVTYYLMVTAIYMAAASTFRHGDHVSITVFRDMMPRRLRNGLAVVYGLLAAAILGIVAWGALHEALGAYARREFLPGIIVWPAWASFVPVAAGVAVLVLRLLLHVWMLALHGEDRNVALEGEPLE